MTERRLLATNSTGDRLLRRMISYILYSGVIGSLALPMVPVIAADSEGGDQLAEVVVQAQRRNENSQSIPIAITNISAAQMAAVGITSAASLEVTVPGLVVVSTQAAFQPRLRGVGTTFFGPGIENPVALYVDNVYYGSQLTAPTDLSDVAQVTVLKGPQGTLFGRNSTGGVLQLSTRAPTADFGGEIRTELDQYLTSRNFIYVTGAVASDLNANVSLKYTAQGDGWGHNLVNGDAIDKIKSDASVRNKWDWTPFDQTEVKLNLDYTWRTDTLGPNYYVPAVAGFTGLFPGIGVTQTSSNKYDVTNWRTNVNHLNQGGGDIEIDQGVGQFKLVSISAYRSYHFHNFSDSNATPTPESGVDYDAKGSQISQEFQLLSPENSPIKWLAGLYYFRATDKLDPQPLYYYDFFSEIFYGAAPTSVASDVFRMKLITESYAGFVQATANLGADTHLTIGGRYTNERRRISGQANNFVDGVPFPLFDLYVDGHDVESRPTWRAALDHSFTPEVLAYASYNRGFKSGGFNAIAASEAPYKAEVVDTYEVGLKSEWLNHTLRLNPAVFYSKYTNMQLLLVQGCCLVATNAAEAKIYGLDLDAEWKATDALSISGGLEYLHARFGEFPGDPTSVAVPGGGLETELQDGRGRKVPLAPNVVADVSVNYRLTAADNRFDFNVTDSYNSGYYWEPDNVAYLGGFNLLNASVTWTASGERLSVGLFGRNLGDKIVPSTESAAAPGSFLASNNRPPRTYGFNVKYKFGAH